MGALEVGRKSLSPIWLLDSLTMGMNGRKHHSEKNNILFLVGAFNHVNHDGEEVLKLEMSCG